MSTYTALRHQHSSLQFSDSPAQQEADIKKLFEKGQSFPIKTGTESGPDNANYDLIAFYAKKFDHYLRRYRANWVAVDRGVIKKRSQIGGERFVEDNANLKGHMPDRGFPFIGFTHVKPGVGRIYVAGFHYATHGRVPLDPNYDANNKYADFIAQWMSDVGQGTNIALGAGDFNMIDRIRKQDWAFGNNFTSMADELGKYFNTGHGPIDGLVSCDADKRVRAKKLIVLDDDKLHLHTDHFVVRGTWSIRHIKEV